jgi:hypothetical protein
MLKITMKFKLILTLLIGFCSLCNAEIGDVCRTSIEVHGTTKSINLIDWIAATFEHQNSTTLSDQKQKVGMAFMGGTQLADVRQCSAQPLNDQVFCEEGFYFQSAMAEMNGGVHCKVPTSKTMALGIGLALGATHANFPIEYANEDYSKLIVDGWAYMRATKEGPVGIRELCSRVPPELFSSCAFGLGRASFFYGRGTLAEASRALEIPAFEAGFEFAYVFAGEQPTRPGRAIQRLAMIMRTGEYSTEPVETLSCLEKSSAFDCVPDPGT